MELTPPLIHMRPTEPDLSPLHVDIINGWALTRQKVVEKTNTINLYVYLNRFKHIIVPSINQKRKGLEVNQQFLVFFTASLHPVGGSLKGLLLPSLFSLFLYLLTNLLYFPYSFTCLLTFSIFPTPLLAY